MCFFFTPSQKGHLNILLQNVGPESYYMYYNVFPQLHGKSSLRGDPISYGIS